MYQMCKHGKQDGEPCEECQKIVQQQIKDKEFWDDRISKGWHDSIVGAIALGIETAVYPKEILSSADRVGRTISTMTDKDLLTYKRWCKKLYEEHTPSAQGTAGKLS